MYYLNCHTYFSLRYGTLSPEQLVAAAKAKGAKALALTDINNTSAVIEFVERCQAAGIKPLVGIEFRQDNRLLYIGIAKNSRGFYELNQLLSEASVQNEPLPEHAPPLKNAIFIYPQSAKPPESLQRNEYIGITPLEVNTLFRSPLMAHPQKLVLWLPVTFAENDEKMWLAHKFLRSIDRNVVLSKLDELHDCASPTEFFVADAFLERRFAGKEFILQNTGRLVENCHFEMETGNAVNQHNFTGSFPGDYDLLERLALQGCERRYGKTHRQALERVKKELAVIRQHRFCNYFLVTWDFVRFAQTSGFWHVGRGSGANSIVAFCIGITDVDPLELDLYFERFINPYRTSPPDFDVDFSWKDRDVVLDYVYHRYRKEHVALLASYSTFNFKSIVREIGKVYGLPKSEIDNIIDHPKAIEKHHELAKVIFDCGKLIEGFPNYLSIHAGGVIISEKPLNYYTALKRMPKGYAVTHFDMHHAVQIGFHKYDILSQRGLGHIKDALELIRKNTGKAVLVDDLRAIMRDPKVKTQLRSGRCTGCFYIESPAMRQLLRKLRCETYPHLVAASSIIRPGVAQSGMMKEYIRRFHAPDKVAYLHPVFAEHLGETFGVMVYQEDVLKILHHFAGLDLGESDVVRRIMTGKKFKEDTLRQLKAKYDQNCRERGYPEALAQEVWRQVESFSGYSFCKAHSASFAVESFQSLYLKTYFPVEHAIAVVNNFGGFYRSEIYLHMARMNGATLHPPCVNRSEHLTILSDADVYLGFIHVHELEHDLTLHILDERQRNGEFTSLANFTERVDVSQIQLDLLIRIGAFRFTKKEKCALMWEANPVGAGEGMLTLFGDEDADFEIPVLEKNELDQAFDEIALLGFPLRSPFDLVADRQELAGCILAAELINHTGAMVRIAGYYVCQKPVRTSKGEMMAFGTWLDISGNFMDTVHFPPSLRQFPFTGNGVYVMVGKVTEEFGVPSVEVAHMKRLAYKKDERC